MRREGGGHHRGVNFKVKKGVATPPLWRLLSGAPSGRRLILPLFNGLSLALHNPGSVLGRGCKRHGRVGHQGNGVCVCVGVLLCMRISNTLPNPARLLLSHPAHRVGTSGGLQGRGGDGELALSTACAGCKFSVPTTSQRHPSCVVEAAAWREWGWEGGREKE